MLFICGAFFVGIGIWLFFVFIRNSKRPRVNNARVIELTSEPWKFAPNQIKNRNMPHALVAYTLDGVDYQQKVLLKSKPQVGDTIQLFVDSSRPDDVEQFHPPREIMIACTMAGVGIIMMIVNLIIMDSMGWW